MAGMKRIETPTMQMISDRLDREHFTVDPDALRTLYPEVFADTRVVQHEPGMPLRTYLEQRRHEMVDLGDGTQVRATWDDLAFWIRTVTGKRVVRESVRNWASRYGIQEPEHDYGVNADDMPSGGETRDDNDPDGGELPDDLTYEEQYQERP
jgi:hypothetical protein